MDKNNKEFERKQLRLPEYNYSKGGAYFLTICTKDRYIYFENKRIREIAEECWLDIPEHFDNIELDSYVIMPNHIHGVIHWENPGARYLGESEKVGTRYILSLQERRKSQKLPIIVGNFKAAVTRAVHKLGFENFKWQRSYYDHIIRNEKELMKTREYIIDNPHKWNEDAENPETWKYSRKIDIDEYYRNIWE